MGVVVINLLETLNRQSSRASTITCQAQGTTTNHPPYTYNQLASTNITLKPRAKDPKMSDVPGPGNYNVPPTIGPSKSKFTLGSKLLTIEPKNPGPGEYQVKDNTMNKSLGIFGKEVRKNSYSNLVPGPGQYTIDNIKKITVPKTMYNCNKHAKPGEKKSCFPQFARPRLISNSIHDWHIIFTNILISEKG